MEQLIYKESLGIGFFGFFGFGFFGFGVFGLFFDCDSFVIVYDLSVTGFAAQEASTHRRKMWFTLLQRHASLPYDALCIIWAFSRRHSANSFFWEVDAHHSSYLALMLMSRMFLGQHPEVGRPIPSAPTEHEKYIGTLPCGTCWHADYTGFLLSCSAIIN